MAKTIVQTLVVEQTGTSIALLPVTNVTEVQQLSVIQPNQDQAVVFQPVT